MLKNIQITTASMASRIIGIAILFLGSQFSFSAENPWLQLISRVKPEKASIQTAVVDSVTYDHIVVKFQEGMGVNLNQGVFQINRANPDMPKYIGTDWTGINKNLLQITETINTNNLEISSLFKINREILAKLKSDGEKKSGNELADLGLYFEIPLQSWYSTQFIENLIRIFNMMPAVEIAYAVPETENASVSVPSLAPQFVYQQGYRNPAPMGIDINYAWGFDGGRGDGVKIVDVEQGWNTTHEDLPTLFHENGTISTSSKNHGTAVLGVVSSMENGYGTTGLVPNAAIGYESHRGIGVAAAITNAATVAGEGGVVLIEVHRKGPETVSCSCNTSQCNYIAIEYWDAEFQAIKTATANGVIVVEAAGNGSANLDDPAYEDHFNRSVRDSGAILVGGSYSDTRAPKCWSNHGSRVDVHGWGENVATLGYGSLYKGNDENDQNQWYAGGFSGTSSASPIVVGAVASLQGIALVEKDRYLLPLEVRSLLTETGTPQESASAALKNIGPLPDLKNAVDYLLDEDYSTCKQFNNSVIQHVNDGRVYSETTQGWWWVKPVVTYFVNGSGEELGSDGNAYITLKEEYYSGNYSQGVCENDNSQENAPEVIIGDFEVSGSTLTASGSATDIDGDLKVVYLEVGGSLYECDGTSQFNCIALDLNNTEYVANIFAEDMNGNVSAKNGNYQFSIGSSHEGNCVTATNFEHTSNGRAYEESSWWTKTSKAVGSDDDLGAVGSQWWSTTTSLKESTTGHWGKVDSCN